MFYVSFFYHFGDYYTPNNPTRSWTPSNEGVANLGLETFEATFCCHTLVEFDVTMPIDSMVKDASIHCVSRLVILVLDWTSFVDTGFAARWTRYDLSQEATTTTTTTTTTAAATATTTPPK